MEESHRLAQEVAAARARVLGTHHPDTLASRFEVASGRGRRARGTRAGAVRRRPAAPVRRRPWGAGRGPWREA
ncbi:hypothetical protein [Streptomyces alkaliterrae]|uniref:hypothetical protein n=1 Tax=Streptomyces alkaliterrae TaxID=2213162 RepID=UPI003F6A172D